MQEGVATSVHIPLISPCCLLQLISFSTGAPLFTSVPKMQSALLMASLMHVSLQPGPSVRLVTSPCCLPAGERPPGTKEEQSTEMFAGKQEHLCDKPFVRRVDEQRLCHRNIC